MDIGLSVNERRCIVKGKVIPLSDNPILTNVIGGFKNASANRKYTYAVAYIKDENNNDKYNIWFPEQVDLPFIIKFPFILPGESIPLNAEGYTTILRPSAEDYTNINNSLDDYVKGLYEQRVIEKGDYESELKYRKSKANELKTPIFRRCVYNGMECQFCTLHHMSVCGSKLVSRTITQALFYWKIPLKAVTLAASVFKNGDLCNDIEVYYNTNKSKQKKKGFNMKNIKGIHVQCLLT